MSDSIAGTIEFLFETAILTALYLLPIGIVAGLLLLPFRKGICAWFDGGRWRRAKVGWAVFGIAYVAMLMMQIFSPIIGIYSNYAARYWMRKAAEAPTREERAVHVRRIVVTGYGTHIAWSAIRRIPDVPMRCELWEVLMDTPERRDVTYRMSEYRDDCGPLPQTPGIPLKK